MKLSKIKLNPDNPRTFDQTKIDKLKKSIEEFPKMMSLRPMVVDQKGIVLGGNMRLTALKQLGYKEVPDEWVRSADELTEEEKKRFVIADNVGFGEWDWELLKADWDKDVLKDWGMDEDLVDQWMIDVNDRNDDEWVGMPEFEAKESPLRLVIHFEEEEDRIEFLEKYPIKVLVRGSKTYSTWWPYKEKEDLKSVEYE